MIEAVANYFQGISGQKIEGFLIKVVSIDYSTFTICKFYYDYEDLENILFMNIDLGEDDVELCIDDYFGLQLTMQIIFQDDWLASIVELQSRGLTYWLSYEDPNFFNDIHRFLSIIPGIYHHKIRPAWLESMFPST